MGSKPKVKDPPKAAPVVTLDNKDADAAARMARQNRADRKGYKSTLLSSEGGSGTTGATATQAGTKNLLG